MATDSYLRVARSCVVNVTDSTNESRAYAIMGYAYL